MWNRRDVILTLASCALVVPSTPPAAAPVAAAARREGFVVVNGWVLTRADLDLLKLDDL